MSRVTGDAQRRRADRAPLTQPTPAEPAACGHCIRKTKLAASRGHKLLLSDSHELAVFPLGYLERSRTCATQRFSDYMALQISSPCFAVHKAGKGRRGILGSLVQEH